MHAITRQPLIVFIMRGRCGSLLRSIDLTWQAFELVQNYFEGRTRQLQCGNSRSHREKIECGVPQGGSLSSPFFVMYFNKLLRIQIAEASYLCYADDTCLNFSFDKDIDWSVIENSVSQVKEWSRRNGLLLNAAKSSYIAFSLKKLSKHRR